MAALGVGLYARGRLALTPMSWQARPNPAGRCAVYVI
jgi:hypothetical protein